MPFRFDEFVALVKAGYTKEEIDAMEKDQAPKEEPQPEPVAAAPAEPVKDKEPAAAEVPANDKYEALQAEIAALRKAIQALNVQNAYRAEDPGAVTPESILASIIQPAKKER